MQNTPEPAIAGRTQASPLNVGARVHLRACRAGEPGTVIRAERGKLVVFWSDLDYWSRHKPEALELAPGSASGDARGSETGPDGKDDPKAPLEPSSLTIANTTWRRIHAGFDRRLLLKAAPPDGAPEAR